MLRRWGWAILVAVLAALGVLLAIADTALYGPTLGPYATFLIGPSQAVIFQRPSPDPSRFIWSRFPVKVCIDSHFVQIGTHNPLPTLRPSRTTVHSLASPH